jgi:hypothetical protein
MYFINSQGTLCHFIADMRTGEAPDPCGSKANKIDLLYHHAGKPSNILPEKPKDIPFCKHCEKGITSTGTL